MPIIAWLLIREQSVITFLFWWCAKRQEPPLKGVFFGVIIFRHVSIYTWSDKTFSMECDITSSLLLEFWNKLLNLIVTINKLSAGWYFVTDSKIQKVIAKCLLDFSNSPTIDRYSNSPTTDRYSNSPVTVSDYPWSNNTVIIIQKTLHFVTE